MTKKEKFKCPYMKGIMIVLHIFCVTMCVSAVVGLIGGFIYLCNNDWSHRQWQINQGAQHCLDPDPKGDTPYIYAVHYKLNGDTLWYVNVSNRQIKLHNVKNLRIVREFPVTRETCLRCHKEESRELSNSDT